MNLVSLNLLKELSLFPTNYIQKESLYRPNGLLWRGLTVITFIYTLKSKTSL